LRWAGETLFHPETCRGGRDVIDTTQALPPKGTKVFIASLMHSQDAAMAHWIMSIVRLCAMLGPENVFVSLVESGSGEETPAFVQLAAIILEALGASYMVVINGQTRANGQGRIEYLAQMRNTALIPLFPSDSDKVPMGALTQSPVLRSKREDLRLPDAASWRVLWINDVFYCAEDMVRLLAHDADVSCGLDVNDMNGGPALYDVWVAKDVDGNMLYHKPPYTVHSTRHRAAAGLPFPVTACWNGAVAMPGRPFADGLLFTAGAGGKDCRSSESERIVTDLIVLGYKRVLVDPSVRLAYERHPANIRYEFPGGSDHVPRLRDWDEVKEDPVVFPPRLPINGRVTCCELIPPNHYVDFKACESGWLQMSPANEWLAQGRVSGA